MSNKWIRNARTCIPRYWDSQSAINWSCFAHVARNRGSKANIVRLWFFLIVKKSSNKSILQQMVQLTVVSIGIFPCLVTLGVLLCDDFDCMKGHCILALYPPLVLVVNLQGSINYSVPFCRSILITQSESAENITHFYSSPVNTQPHTEESGLRSDRLPDLGLVFGTNVTPKIFKFLHCCFLSVIVTIEISLNSSRNSFWRVADFAVVFFSFFKRRDRTPHYWKAMIIAPRPKKTQCTLSTRAMRTNSLPFFVFLQNCEHTQEWIIVWLKLRFSGKPSIFKTRESVCGNLCTGKYKQ